MRFLNDHAVLIALALVAAIAALVTVVIVANVNDLAATGLRDLVILLAGALAGYASKDRKEEP